MTAAPRNPAAKSKPAPAPMPWDYAARFDETRGVLPGASASWLAALRERGFAHFAATGLPGPRNEEWKYTTLNPLQKSHFALAPRSLNGIHADTLPLTVSSVEAAHRLVFVNGWYRADLSRIGALPPGVEIATLAQAIAERPDLLEGRLGSLAEPDGLPMVALNTAFMSDGVVLRVGKGVVLEKPLVALFVGDASDGPVAYHPRHLFLAEAGSQATIVEHHIGLGQGAYFANSATEILVEEGAILRHCKIQDEAAEAFHTATTVARVARSGNFDSFVFSLGSRLARNEIRVALAGEGAGCRLNGGYLAKGKQHTDNTTIIDHRAPHTSSREVYKGVLDGQARAVFQGRIVVRPDAQKSDGQQLNNTLLLSTGAEIDSKPALDIQADDVKCSHGATAGALDDDALFYLRSRGIPEERAQRILVEAFLGDVIDGIALAGLREPLEEMVAHWMNG
jgi:Fe-S cluster assembly protein SufD